MPSADLCCSQPQPCLPTSSPPLLPPNPAMAADCQGDVYIGIKKTCCTESQSPGQLSCRTIKLQCRLELGLEPSRPSPHLRGLRVQDPSEPDCLHCDFIAPQHELADLGQTLPCHRSFTAMWTYPEDSYMASSVLASVAVLWLCSLTYVSML